MSGLDVEMKPLARFLLFTAMALALSGLTAPARDTRDSRQALTVGLIGAMAEPPALLQAGTPLATPTASETPTPTLEPTLTPTPSPTPVPLLDWIGQPTYPGESAPGVLFRLYYDPTVWTLNDPFGDPVLVHSTLNGCMISTAAGRGMPPGWRIENRMGLVGGIPFEISTAFVRDVPQFTNYLGGDLRLYTGFQVRYGEQVEECLREAEIVLATLRSVTPAELTATPTPTPTLTPTPTPTPLPSTGTPAPETPTPSATP